MEHSTDLETESDIRLLKRKTLVGFDELLQALLELNDGELLRCLHHRESYWSYPRSVKKM